MQIDNETAGKNEWKRDAVICSLLAVSILAVFWNVRGFEFTGYDDHHYVSKNPKVAGGLTLRAIWWAFTTGYFSYWHPLTWISHMIDVQLFGMNAGAHHLMSVFIHVANSICLYFGLKYIAGSWGKSAFVAALFALHPTHVESVAWIAERKDVLSGFFWITCVWAYGWYARKGGFWRYATSVFLFACGLMSKPMVVTLPCALLLLDYWPLQRLPQLSVRRTLLSASDGNAGLQTGVTTIADRSVRLTWKRILIEKIPFFIGVLMSCAVTLYGVSRAGAIVSDERFSLGLRVANTPISYVRYLAKLFWPMDLVVLYPMPPHWELWKVIGATLVLLAMTAVFVALARRAGYLLVGWLWYLGTLVPTVGLISVGLQSIADRYTYIPFIGLFVIIAWSAPKFRGCQIIAVAIIAALSVVSWHQVQVWRNTETLFAQCVRATKGNAEAYYNLALAQYLNGKRADATRNFQEAIRIRPQYENAHNNLGLLLLESGDPQAATNVFTSLLRLDPNHEVALLNMGRALVQLGDQTQAKGYLEAARGAEARLELGRLLEKMNRTNEAQLQFREAERLRPGITRRPSQPKSPAAPAQP